MVCCSYRWIAKHKAFRFFWRGFHFVPDDKNMIQLNERRNERKKSLFVLLCGVLLDIICFVMLEL